MRILAIADQHGYLPSHDLLPECDLFIVAGDVCPVDLPHDVKTQTGWLKKRYAPWLVDVQAEMKVVIAGNHDFALQEIIERGKWARSYGNDHYADAVDAIENTGAVYLVDEAVEYGGKKIFGTPWTPRFMDWAFMYPDAMLFEKFKHIPDDTNILVSHGPPLGFGDWTTFTNEHAGSASLRRRMGQLEQLELSFFGHMHNGHGVWEDHGDNSMMFPNRIRGRMHNVSLRNDRYDIHEPARLRSLTHYMEVE